MRYLGFLSKITFVCLLAVTCVAAPASAAVKRDSALPNSTLTPGSVYPGVDKTTLCTSPPPQDLKVDKKTTKAVQKHYKLNSSGRSKTTIDHLIPAKLGGDDSPANLWPQPKKGPNAVNAKNAFEDQLHVLVCANTISVGAAQDALRVNWLDGQNLYRPFPVPAPPMPTTVAPPTTTTTAAPPTTAASTQASSPATTAVAPKKREYTNVDGNRVEGPDANQEGATARCKDGTYSHSQHRSGTCSHHGGIAE